MKNTGLYVMLACLATAWLISCGTDKGGFETTPSGLRYRFISSSNGQKPAPGDVMIMHISYRTPADSVLFDSKVKGDSFTVKLVAPTFTGGVEEGFAMMSPGDSAIFIASADSLFEKTFFSSLPAYLEKGSFITFQVRLKNIIPAAVSDSIERARDIELRRQEFDRIETFLRQNNMDVMPTENGAYLLTSQLGPGAFPEKGDTIFVKYTGRLLDGTVFEQSEGDEPFGFVLGANQVIPGWEECFPLLNQGSVARMVIPSDLGYGALPNGALPGYSTMVFDVEVVRIAKRPALNDNSSK